MHKLPAFTADEVLFCSEEMIDHTRILWLNHQVRASTEMGKEDALKKAVKSGKYKIIAYEPFVPEGAVWDVERECYLSSDLLRHFARENKLPLVILSPREKSEDAPVLPGIPSGIRQYWHCPQCP